MKDWIAAFRLRTLPLAFSCIITGLAAIPDEAEVPWNIFLLAILTTLLLQILSNLANDLGDFQNGADNQERVGPARAVQSGKISANQMKIAIIVTAVLAFLCGSFLLFVAFSGNLNFKHLIFLVLGLLSIAAAVKYTAGKNPYGYSGLGDISVLLFFGLIGVAGSNYLFYQDWNALILLPAFSIGAFSAGVLNLNNMRDIVNDRNSGKITIAVRLGSHKAKIYHIALIIAGWISITFWILSRSENSSAYLVFLSILPFMLHLKRISAFSAPQQFDTELKKLALATFAFSVSLFIVFLLI